jgi:hypothetical protein
VNAAAAAAAGSAYDDDLPDMDGFGVPPAGHHDGPGLEPRP